MFELHLNVDMMREFVSNEEINGNKKSSQKKITLNSAHQE